jgi:hypothetical protein
MGAQAFIHQPHTQPVRAGFRGIEPGVIFNIQHQMMVKLAGGDGYFTGAQQLLRVSDYESAIKSVLSSSQDARY